MYPFFLAIFLVVLLIGTGIGAIAYLFPHNQSQD